MVNDISLESVVSIEGLVKEEKQAPEVLKFKLKSMVVLSKADLGLPIPVVEEKGGEPTDVPVRLDWRWIDLRKEENLLIFKVWTELERGFRKYFEDSDFMQIYTPSLMGTASETGADVFKLQYFDREAYLAQSPQFYKQMAQACGFEKFLLWDLFLGPNLLLLPTYD